MKRNRTFGVICSLAMATIGTTAIGSRGDSLLQDKDIVAVCGDSITEQKIYSVFIETYLLACKPKTDLKIDQFGWSGEQAVGFAPRIGTDVLPFHPTFATTCYGMNDGHYAAMNPQTGDAYREAMKKVIAELKAGGVRTIVVGAPGCVDTKTYKRPGNPAEVYNQTLGALADIARDLAKENDFPYADVHGEMMKVMTAAKAKYGNDFAFVGGDGVHPPQAGHLVMAYAFLKAMGCDGDVGTITVDGDHAEATDGHKILSARDNTIEIESSRMPFCFLGDGKSASSERSVADLFAFNPDLNRFMLVVKNLKSEHAKIIWGDQSKEFSADALGKGINLAAEFEETNPFTASFTSLEKAVGAQQTFETPLTKSLLHSAADMKKGTPDAAGQIDDFNASAMKLDEALFAAASKMANTPVRHTIKIEPM